MLPQTLGRTVFGIWTMLYTHVGSVCQRRARITRNIGHTSFIRVNKPCCTIRQTYDNIDQAHRIYRKFVVFRCTSGEVQMSLKIIRGSLNVGHGLLTVLRGPLNVDHSSLQIHSHPHNKSIHIFKFFLPPMHSHKQQSQDTRPML